MQYKNDWVRSCGKIFAYVYVVDFKCVRIIIGMNGTIYSIQAKKILK